MTSPGLIATSRGLEILHSSKRHTVPVLLRSHHFEHVDRLLRRVDSEANGSESGSFRKGKIFKLISGYYRTILHQQRPREQRHGLLKEYLISS